MNKIPMQIYFDPDTAAFYKMYAQAVGKSFAAVIREIVIEKKLEIVSKKKFPRKTAKKTLQHPLLKAFNEVAESLKDLKYHYPEKTDDELLYGK